MSLVATSANAVPFPGPNAFGYTGSEIAPNLRNIAGTGTEVVLGDDQLSSLIGFSWNFDFYGNSYSSVYVSSNGFLQFPDAFDLSNGCCSGQTLGDGLFADNLIAGLWMDLNSRSGSDGHMYYQDTGSEFIVGFYNVAQYWTGNPVTFEMILHAGSNNIELQYGSVLNGSVLNGDSFTLGITNLGDTDGLTLYQGYEPAQFSDRGFLITAVPEPGTMLLLGAGLLGLAARRRRAS